MRNEINFVEEWGLQISSMGGAFHWPVIFFQLNKITNAIVKFQRLICFLALANFSPATLSKIFFQPS